MRLCCYHIPKSCFQDSSYLIPISLPDLSCILLMVDGYKVNFHKIKCSKGHLMSSITVSTQQDITVLHYQSHVNIVMY